MNSLDIRAAVVARAVTQKDKPYEWGALGPDSFDCSGLVWDALKHNGLHDVYGPQVKRDAATLWALGIASGGPAIGRVEWKDRMPGDVVCYGDALRSVAHHVMLVESGSEVTRGWLIGALHGGPPHYGESHENYRKRMVDAGAAVRIVSSDYWASARIGVIRSAILVEMMQSEGAA